VDKTQINSSRILPVPNRRGSHNKSGGDIFLIQSEFNSASPQVITKSDGFPGQSIRQLNYQGNFNFSARLRRLEIIGKGIHTHVNVDFLMITVTYALVRHMKSAVIGKSFQDHCSTGLIYISMFLESPTKTWLIYGHTSHSQVLSR